MYRKLIGALAALLFVSATLLSTPSAAGTKTYTLEAATASALKRINAMREEAGLAPVELHPKMSAHAQAMAEDWAAGEKSREIWDYNSDSHGSDAFVPVDMTSWRGCRHEARKPKKMHLSPITYTEGEAVDNIYLAFGWAPVPGSRRYLYVVYTFTPYEGDV
ncbi:hypothetical protein BKA08_001865 [Nocardioides marinisabuli]|uniref:SCP domain-containing protein n=1 Tax=Nocardioides marinisabuli TaxID=419476 RepID=A0A7Y9F110_9ACTN|nr:hypothetical protein [Nocardioides marinisabuli]NYD57627.1 hypothetical protein [Nocardioides marinisabuli]